MRRLLGQATIASAVMTHRLLSVAFGLGMFCVVVLGALSWRLAQGPIDLGFLAGHIEAALNSDGGPTRISIGGIALTWEGFHGGLERPVDLRLRAVRMSDASGRTRLEVPDAAITVSPRWLLRGRVRVSALELDSVRLTLVRGKDGTVTLDMGTLSEAMDSTPQTPEPFTASLAELMRPLGQEARGDSEVLSLLKHVLLANFAITIRDDQLGRVWQIPRLDADLRRRDGGGIDLSAEASVVFGAERAGITVSATSSGDRDTIQTRFAMTPVDPSVLARDTPALAGLAVVNAPVTVRGEMLCSAALVPKSGRLTVTLGAGALRIRKGTMPLHNARLEVHGTADALVLDTARLVLPGIDGRPDTTVAITGTAERNTDHARASLAVSLDHLAFPDLARFWPPGLGGGARPWLVENITAGTARDGRVDVTLEANADLSNLRMTQASGGLEGEDVTVHWFRPVPPVEQARAHLRITDPDTIDITFLGGRQRVGAQVPIVVTGGSMHITGMSVKDQDADITVLANGTLPDVLALLKEPRLKLLSTHPMDLREPAGDAAVTLRVKLPLESKLDIEDVDIGVTAQLRRGHLTGVVAGRNLDQAELEFAADKKKLTVKGTGLLAGITTKLDGLMDFQAHRPADIQQRITATATATAPQLIAAGLPIGDVASGEMPIQAIWSKRNDGDATVALSADLTTASLALPPLGWRKAAGIPAKGTARLILTKDQLTSIAPISVDGTDIVFRGSTDVTDNVISAVRMDHLVLGRTDLTGSVRLPPRGPIAIELTAATLDLADKVSEKTPPRDRSLPEPPPGPAWTLHGTAARVLLAHGKRAQTVRMQANFDGRVFRALSVKGTTDPNGPFAVEIAQDRGPRHMEVQAQDAGALLQGLDVTQSVEGGLLSLNGTFDDADPAHPLRGLAEMTEFRVRGVLALGKLLQAMTLYGLVDVVRGPGLAFARLSAPFAHGDDVLTLTDARAFSPSLGLTVKGKLDLNAETEDLEGTIVPAYFFNSLLGRIPFVGGLFSAEKGGGLFAARFSIRGPMADPSVLVNPLSMLTPGILRSIFGIF